MKKYSGTNSESATKKPAKTGFRVVVHESISRFPVSDTKITFYPGGRSVTTKAKGMCFIELDEGTYTYTIKAPNYPLTEGTATIVPGVMQLLYIKMEKASNLSRSK